MTAAVPLSVRIAGCALSLTTSLSSFSLSLDSTVQAVVVNIWKYNTSVVSPCVYCDCAACIGSHEPRAYIFLPSVGVWIHDLVSLLRAIP